MMEKEPAKSGASEVACNTAKSVADLEDADEKVSPAITPEAQRALAEAEERRAAAREGAKAQEKELGGQDGPEPTRYGDWEKGGIASDF